MSNLAGTIVFITYLGTASFLIEYEGTTIITDPGDFLTGRLTEDMAGSLDAIDAILVTHADFDHTNRIRNIQDIERIPIVGPRALVSMLPGYTVLTDRNYRIGGISITRLKSVHGVRHDVEHWAYIIAMGDVSLCFLGDAYRVSEFPDTIPDVAFVTVGGLESNPKNGAALVASLGAAFAIPMHWEVLLRTSDRAEEFCGEASRKVPMIGCYIPQFNKRFSIRKSDRIVIE